MQIAHVLLTLSLLLAGGLPLTTQAAPSAISLKSIAQVELEVIDQDGLKTLKRQPVLKATPATEVIYTTTFVNTTAQGVRDVVITNPIPANTRYQADSAFGNGCAIDFSADGSQTFAAASRLKVNGPDGRPRPAVASDYTHIRWRYQGLLAPGQTGEVGFRSVIR